MIHIPRLNVNEIVKPLLLAAFIALCTLSPTHVQAAIWFDDFDSYTTGTAPDGTAWANIAGYMPVTSAERSFSSPNYLVASSTSGGNAFSPLIWDDGAGAKTSMVITAKYWYQDTEGDVISNESQMTITPSDAAFHFFPSLVVYNNGAICVNLLGGYSLYSQCDDDPIILTGEVLTPDSWNDIAYYITSDGTNIQVRVVAEGYDSGYMTVAHPYYPERFYFYPGGSGSENSVGAAYLDSGVDDMTVYTDADLPPGDDCSDGITRLCGFTPENDTVLEATDGFAEVPFTLDAWINSEDVGATKRVKVRLHNIDQNVLLLGFASPGDVYLLNETLGDGEDGHFSFATTTTLASGNYRLEAWIEKTIFFGFLQNPFGDDNDQVISKQFIVGEGTYIGNLSQNGFNILNGEINSRSATSSLALVARCNPLGTYGFDMIDCLSGLFVPDANQLQVITTSARDGILTRMPWGYITRSVVILSGTATSTLPSFTTTFAQNNASDTTTLTFNPGDMLAGGGALLDSIEDPYTGATARTVFEPMIKLAVALMVILTIFADITGSHRHHAESPGEVAARRKRV